MNQQQSTSHLPIPATPSLQLTHALLRSFYSHISTLAALLPLDTLREDDDDAFKALLTETIVGTLEAIPIKRLEKEDGTPWGMGMKEVSSRLGSLWLVRTSSEFRLTGLFRSSREHKIVSLRCTRRRISSLRLRKLRECGRVSRLKTSSRWVIVLFVSRTFRVSQ